MSSRRVIGAVVGLGICAAALAFAVPPRGADPIRVTERRPPVGVSATDGPRWFESARGWVITDDVHKAEWAALGLEKAAEIFERHFGVKVPKGVIVETRYSGFVDAMPADQRVWILPWSTSAFDLEGDSEKAATDEHHLDGASSVRHELGHAFFLAVVIPNARKHQYGGDAPDWLDEAAAMIVETDAVLEKRRHVFARQVCSGRLIPLDAFLARGHPVFASPKMKKILETYRGQKIEQPVMIDLTLHELGLDEQSVGDFYAEARAVYDYLLDRSGDRRILGRVAQAIRDSGNATSWQDSKWFGEAVRLRGATLSDDFARWARSRARSRISNCGISA